MLVILDNIMLCKEELIMERYVGLKLVKAEPCTVKEYNKTVRPLMYTGECQEGYKIEYEDNYISWSPKEVFEKAYRKTINLTFGLALEELKRGEKVARKGWNGKGMWLVLVPTGFYDVGVSKTTDKIDGLLPWVGMKTADNKFVPWLPSQTDLLAEDWAVI